MKQRVLLALGLLLAPLSTGADYLEVKRNAHIYAEPSRQSERIFSIKLEEGEGPYLLVLLSDDRVNGYYRVRLRGQDQAGWIYKSLVRRRNGEHPEYVPYKRSLYRHWIDADRDCQDTRAEVLIRGNTGSIEFKTEKECRVIKGRWIGPYTGDVFEDAGKLDIDHVVPLKNAHESGAWAWSKESRKRYANDLENNNHLLAVHRSENRRKGARGPDQYLPPLESYHCEYVRIWAQIKADWELEMTEAEGQAVQQILDGCS